MSEQPDKDSRTEDATQRKRDDAIGKGNTPVSREVSLFASILAIAIVIPVFASSLEGDAMTRLGIFLERPADFTLETSGDLTALLMALLLAVAPVVLPPLLIIMAVGVAASLLQNPFRIAAERIKPDFSRISPSQGWKRLFGASGWLELLKAIVKLMIISAVVYTYLWRHRVEIIEAQFMSPHDAPQLIAGRLSGLAATVAACFAGLVVADVAWTRFKWHADLRMSKQEIKDEHKQAEGDPMIRARQRAIARDRARRRMMAAVPRATMVVANPTHYAVALRYVRGESDTPVVIAKGLDNIAIRIRAIAEEHDIPVIEDVALARSLYAAVVTDRPIPPEFYKAVAEIIMFLMARGRAAPMMQPQGV